MDSITVSASNVTAADNTEFQYRVLPDYTRVQFGQGAVIVYSSVTGAREIMPVNAERLLQACDKFATLDEHAQRLAVQFQLPPNELPVLRNNLEQFASSGLLLSRHQILSKCVDVAIPPEVAPTRIEAVGIPTCGRPENLRSCLSSYAESVRATGRSPAFIVADDTRDDAVIEQNVEVLKELKKQYSIEIFYVGKREKVQLAETLSAESGLPRSIIDFAVLNAENCPVGTGANRNNLLLATVGLPHMQVDDDTTSQAACVPDYQANLTLTSSDNPNDIWFEEELMNVDSWPIVDVLALHEQMLGKSVTKCMENGVGDVNVDTVGESFLSRLKTDGGRVLVTAMGTAGDSGLGWSNQYLRYRGAIRERLMRSEESYRQALGSHRQVRGANASTITDSPFCVSMNLGLDNRQPLPPFIPVQRKQDNMFARLVHASVPGSLFGFMPWTIVHGKPGVTRRDFDRGRNRFSDICWNLLNIEASFCQAKTAQANLTDIGNALMRIGSASQAEFEELAAGTMWMIHSRDVIELQELLRIYEGQPSFWAADVVQYIKDLRQALPRPRYIVPVDLAASFGDDAARKMAPRLVYRFGEILTHWITIRKAAEATRLAHARKI